MNGDWIETALGGKAWPLELRAEDVESYDIAHALSNICRFGGHCRVFYSVAQHSCLVHDLLESQSQPDGILLAGLLHDAVEAYMGDVVRPIKHTELMKPYRLAEKHGLEAIFLRHGLSMDSYTPAVSKADERVLRAEGRDLMCSSGRHWTQCVGVEPWPAEQIVPLSPGRAKREFLFRLRKYRDIISGRGVA